MITPPHSGTFQRSLDKLAPRSNRTRALPSIDLNTGIVLLIMRGELVQRWHPEPRILEATLAKAVRPVFANTRDGLAAARARGRTGGRRPKLTPDQANHAQQLYDAGNNTVQRIPDLLQVQRSSIYGLPNKTSIGRRPTAGKPQPA